MIKYSDIEITGSLNITGSLVVDGVSQMTSSNATSAETASVAIFSNTAATASVASVVTSVNANTINAGTVPVLRLGSSGTRNNTTFLRGDNTWATVSSPSPWTEVVMQDGFSNSTLAGPFEVAFNTNDQWQFRINPAFSSFGSTYRTLRRSGYWIPSSNVGASNQSLKLTVNQTTWQPFWADFSLTYSTAGAKEWMVISADPESLMNQAQLDADFVYQFVGVHGDTFNRLAYRRLTNIGAGYDMGF